MPAPGEHVTASNGRSNTDNDGAPSPVSGSPEALSVEEIYRRHGHMVLRRARALLRDDNDALDVLQQIFLSLLDEPERFTGRASVTTWLYRVTTNRCLNRLRDSSTRARLLEQRGASLLAGEPRADATEWAIARQLLDRMPDELAQVTIYHAIDGMTQQEIAEVLGCSRRHVGNLLERARRWARSAEDTSRPPFPRPGRRP